MYNIQAEHAEAVTPSDTTEFNPSTLYIGTAGNLVVKTVGGETLTFSNVVAGTFIPVVVIRVLSSTTAANIVRLY